MRAELLGKESELQKYLRHVDKFKVHHKILALTSLKLHPEDQLAGLTSRQRGALLSAMAWAITTCLEKSRHSRLRAVCE